MQRFEGKDVGVPALRAKLSELLLAHLKDDLPGLYAELNKQHRDLLLALEQLGAKRSTSDERRRYLMSAAVQYQSIVNTAVSAQYSENEFFGSVNAFMYSSEDCNMNRLRAAVHGLNYQYASQMRRYGHKFRIPASKGVDGTETANAFEPQMSKEYAAAKGKQQSITFDQAVQWAKTLRAPAPVQVLPGDLNPFLMCEIFQKQSEYWEALSAEHLDRINILCNDLVVKAIKYVVPPDVTSRLLDLKLKKALEKRRLKAVHELSQILNDKQRSPLMCDPACSRSIRKARSLRTKEKFLDLVDASKTTSTLNGNIGPFSFLNEGPLRAKIDALFNEDDGDRAVEEALIGQIAFYKVRL